jgi:hypothetical protein
MSDVLERVKLAPGADALMRVRLNGQKPGEVVLVHVGKRVGFSVVQYAPGCDWTCLAGLDVMLVVHGDGGRQALNDIAPYPKNLWLWQGDKGADVLVFAKPRDRVRYLREMEALTTDAAIVAFHKRWMPEWAHREKYEWEAKVYPWHPKDSEAYACA